MNYQERAAIIANDPDRLIHGIGDLPAHPHSAIADKLVFLRCSLYHVGFWKRRGAEG